MSFREIPVVLTPELKEKVGPLLNRFGPLPEGIMEELIAHARYGEASRGRIFIHQGDFNDDVCLVLEGVVRAYHTVEDKEYTDWFALRGQFFSAVNCYFQGVPSTHTYHAVRPSRYLRFPKSVIEGMAERHHLMERFVRATVTESFLILQNRIVYHRFKTAAERYEELLADTPDLFQQVPLKYIASYMGVSPETLSRIRAGQ